MKISYGKSSMFLNNYSISIAGRVFALESSERTVTIDVDGIKLFLEGEFYYSVVGLQSTRIPSGEGLVTHITSLIRNHGVDSLPKHLEGSYVCCWVDISGHKAGFFGDMLNRVPVYYAERDDSILISTSLRDLASQSRGLNQLSLYSYLLLGYTPARDTFYSGVNKLSGDEYLIFSDTGIEHKLQSLPIKIDTYSDKDLYRYDDLFSNAVASRASNNNVVMSSGGWDSTAILYKLIEFQPKGSVSAAAFSLILPNGEKYNRYEVDKATRIGKFYSINTEIAEINYNDQSLIDYWNSHVEIMKNNHTYFWLHHLKIADMIGNNANPDTRVFNGEVSDSIHNFGFSQTLSVNYNNMGLREIADKAKNFLYGPSFFKSIENEQGIDNKVFNFFRSYHGKDKFVDVSSLNINELRRSYFEAFVFSINRVPFAKWQMEIARDSLQHDFTDRMYSQYFSDMVEQCQPETLYYWLLQLYRRFHFNSYSIGITGVALQSHQLCCVMPFLDSQLLDYMYRMPENWGRGLELRPTKYPLRFLSEHKWRMPLDILMENGPRSYISEGSPKWSHAGGGWNINCEILFESVFANYFKSVLRNVKLEEIFDSSLFNLDQLRSVMESYIEGEKHPEDTTILFRLAVLFSIGFIP